MTISRILGVVAASLVITGCDDDPLAPLTGDQYLLQSIAGVELPAPYAPNLEHVERIIADTMAFQANGEGVRRTVYEGNPDPANRRTEESAFVYVTQDDRVEVTFACPQGAACIGGPHLVGTRSVSQLVITESVVSRSPLVFVRLYPPD
jgi:hypothetical protein